MNGPITDIVAYLYFQGIVLNEEQIAFINDVIEGVVYDAKTQALIDLENVTRSEVLKLN